MRLFLGIAPDAPTREAIGAATARLESALGATATAFRWTRTDNVHVTLHFLGEVPPARLEALRRVIGEPIAEPPFAAGTGRFGAFPERGAPRVIWLGVDHGADAMTRLHAALAGRLRRLDIAVEDRPFTPHFTIARARDRHGPRSVRDEIAAVPVATASWTVAAATLFRSDLSGAAPKYERVIEADLVGPRRTT